MQYPDVLEPGIVAFDGGGDLTLRVPVAHHPLDHDQVMPMLRLGSCLGAIGKHAGECLDQMAVVEGLENMCDRTGLERTFYATRAMACQGNDGHGALAEDLASRLDTAETRQVQVDQDHVGPMLPRQLDRLDSVTGIRAHVESRVLENKPQIGTNDRIVFNCEDTGCRKRCHDVYLLFWQ